jgi:hypothetical protein
MSTFSPRCLGHTDDLCEYRLREASYSALNGACQSPGCFDTLSFAKTVSTPRYGPILSCVTVNKIFSSIKNGIPKGGDFISDGHQRGRPVHIDKDRLDLNWPMQPGRSDDAARQLAREKGRDREPRYEFDHPVFPSQVRDAFGLRGNSGRIRRAAV